MTNIDPYPVSELTNRYNIGKQAVYNRLEALKIKPADHSNRSYIFRLSTTSIGSLAPAYRQRWHDGGFRGIYHLVLPQSSGLAGHVQWTN